MACDQCSGTGRAGKEYCGCKDGELLKRQERAAKRSERMQRGERERKAEKAAQMELLPEKDEKSGKIEPPFQLYDWVIVTKGANKGVIGVVTHIKTGRQKAFVEAVRRSNGQAVNGATDFDWDVLEKIETPPKRTDVLAMIDMALDSRDRDWFDELTSRLVNC